MKMVVFRSKCVCILQVYDLKGSMRNRYAEKTGKDVEVFLDENLVESK